MSKSTIKFNNPFNALNLSNINNIDLHHIINENIIKYSKDLIKENKSYDDFQYFCNNRLNDYELSTNINKRNVSTNFLIDLHGSAKNKKSKIIIPKNVYIIALEHNGTNWSSQTINYLFERMKLQNIYDESFIKSIITELSLLELFNFDLLFLLFTKIQFSLLLF